MRRVLKRAVQGFFFIGALPAAVLCGFGRVEILFTFFAQSFAMAPGFLGSFARAAFYKLTLRDCSIDVVIGLGSYFSRSGAVVGNHVSIGSYCVIGQAMIGARSQISSHVEIPGGRAQHFRDQNGRLSNTVETPDAMLTIGQDCWIGAGAIVMANVGAQTTIGAGSVVVKDIPGGVVAVGVPAKPI